VPAWYQEHLGIALESFGAAIVRWPDDKAGDITLDTENDKVLESFTSSIHLTDGDICRRSAWGSGFLAKTDISRRTGIRCRYPKLADTYQADRTEISTLCLLDCPSPE
jgi:hypothetical protein